jgi:glycosyltransferase involved in cell wall biosynthesis
VERRLGYEFVIAGTGSLAERLLAQAEALPNLTVTPNISSRDAQSLRAATSVGVFPTRVIPGFIETFCVAALEYQALAVPVLAGAIGGVPEATPDDRSLVQPSTPAEEWLPAGRSAARPRAASPRSSPARSAPGGWPSWRSSPPAGPTGASR